MKEVFQGPETRMPPTDVFEGPTMKTTIISDWHGAVTAPGQSEMMVAAVPHCCPFLDHPVIIQSNKPRDAGERAERRRYSTDNESIHDTSMSLMCMIADQRS